MNENDLNIEYICEKTLLNKDDELVPIILDLIQESYKAGLCQAEFDNTMNLIEENEELKQKYENAVADYETTMAEKEQLKKQLEDKEDYINKLQATKDKLDKWDYENTMQQKEFIKYLENEIKIYSNTYMGEMLKELKEILQKYKSIIGVSDDNKTDV